MQNKWECLREEGVLCRGVVLGPPHALLCEPPLGKEKAWGGPLTSTAAPPKEVSGVTSKPAAGLERKRAAMVVSNRGGVRIARTRTRQSAMCKCATDDLRNDQHME